MSAITGSTTSAHSNVAVARVGDIPPTGLTATGSREVDLDWTAPTLADETLTEYFVQYESASRADLAEFNTGRTDAEYTVTGLRPGTTYTFHVSAVFSVGRGSPAATATAATPAASGAPGKPAGLTARAVGETSIWLSWTPAAEQGVTGYRVEVSPNGVDQWTSAETNTANTFPRAWRTFLSEPVR